MKNESKVMILSVHSYVLENEAKQNSNNLLMRSYRTARSNLSTIFLWCSAALCVSFIWYYKPRVYRDKPLDTSLVRISIGNINKHERHHNPSASLFLSFYRIMVYRSSRLASPRAMKR